MFIASSTKIVIVGRQTRNINLSDKTHQPYHSSSVDELMSLAAIARVDKDFKTINQIGDALERREVYDKAWQLLSEVALSRKKTQIQEWDAGPLEGIRLLVERRMRHIGADLRMGRFLSLAADAKADIISSVDYRLVTLFKRSFPNIEVADKDSSVPHADKSASYEALAKYFGHDAEKIRASFIPLIPNPDQKHYFRDQYSTPGLPVVGIAWHSSNNRKELPSHVQWSRFVGNNDANFVSLQYDEKLHGIDEISRLSGKHIVSSGCVDQFIDLEGFAAQVASVDLVVTISNTTAHMAGALGIPCIVLLDDLFHLSWPVNSSTTPFYPRTTLIRRQMRDWNDVFDTVSHVIQCPTRSL